ncbi:TPM domain-containing protein [Clostridiales bacterium COT073_COT-073]|nr:TPM domain-containing protein [Clostridiales bacterium COT073_COT-073]
MKSMKIPLRSLMCCIVLLIPLFLWGAGLPVDAANSKNYLMDNAHLFDQQDQELIQFRLSQNNEDILPYSPAVVITSGGNALPARQDLQSYAQSLTVQEQFAQFEDIDLGVIFLFINQSPAGTIEMAVIPTGKQAIFLTQYDIVNMEKTTARTYADTQNWDETVASFLRLILAYQYPFINELEPGHLSPEDVEAASQEIWAWEEQYGYPIVFLLTSELSPDLKGEYLANYFHTAGFGEGNNGRGAFILYDASEEQAYIELYELPDTDDTKLQALVDDLSYLLSQNYALEAVYAVEFFLDPEADVPLVSDSDLSEIESTTVDPDNLLDSDQHTALFQKTNVFYERLGYHFLTHLYASAQNTIEQPLPEYLEHQLDLAIGEHGSGMIILFDQEKQDYELYATGELNDFLDSNKKIIQPVLQHLKKQLKKEDFSGESILQHQLNLMAFMEFLMAYQQPDLYLISDDPYATQSQEAILIMGNCATAGLRPMVISRGFPERTDTDEEWIKQFEAMIKAAKIKDQLILMYHFTLPNQVYLRYYGDNSKIADLTEKEITEKVQAMAIAEPFNPDAAIMTFMENVESELLPFASASENNQEAKNNSPKDKPSKQAEKADATSKASSKNWLKISLLVGGAIILLILLILAVVLITKKKKGAAAGYQVQGYPNQPQNWPDQAAGWSGDYSESTGQMPDQMQGYPNQPQNWPDQPQNWNQ